MVVERFQEGEPERSRQEVWQDITKLGHAEIRKTKDQRPVESVIGDLLRTDPLARELWREYENSKTP